MEHLENFVQEYLDDGSIEPCDYVGFHREDPKKPFYIKLGMIEFEVEFIMNERSNGDYDGLEGFNIEAL